MGVGRGGLRVRDGDVADFFGGAVVAGKLAVLGVVGGVDGC